MYKKNEEERVLAIRDDDIEGKGREGEGDYRKIY